MFFSIPRSICLSFGLLLAAGLARAQSSELAQRQGLESVWKKSGRTTRVLDFPFSPQPGKYGGPDTRKWGNKGYIFINPKLRDYEKITPLPPRKEPELQTLIGEEETRRQLEEEIARREKAEAELRELKKEVGELKEKAEDEAIKNEQLKIKLEDAEAAGAVPGTGSPGTGGRLVVEKTDTYLVQKDDSLWKIAGRPEVYGDSYRWLLLYHANRDQIFEPDLIYPGMVLLVPRYRGMETARPPAPAPQPEEKQPEAETKETGEAK
jgi:nucleoid-associated protein YgaU